MAFGQNNANRSQERLAKLSSPSSGSGNGAGNQGDDDNVLNKGYIYGFSALAILTLGGFGYEFYNGMTAKPEASVAEQAPAYV